MTGVPEAAPAGNSDIAIILRKRMGEDARELGALAALLRTRPMSKQWKLIGSSLRSKGLDALRRDLDAMIEHHPDDLQSNASWWQSTADGLDQAVAAWTAPALFSVLPESLPRFVGPSFTTTINEVSRCLGYLSYFSPWSHPIQSALSWTALAEVMSRPWAYGFPPRFGLSSRLMIGHDLHRVSVALEMTDSDMSAIWMKRIIEPIEAHNKIADQWMGAPSYSDAEDRNDGLLVSALLPRLDLILTAIRAMCPQHDLPTDVVLGTIEPPTPTPKDPEDLKNEYPWLTKKPKAFAVLTALITHPKPWGLTELAGSRPILDAFERSGPADAPDANAIRRWLRLLEEDGLAEESLGHKWTFGRRARKTPVQKS